VVVDVVADVVVFSHQELLILAVVEVEVQEVYNLVLVVHGGSGIVIIRYKYQLGIKLWQV
jgi:hypothetical protein